MSFGGPSAGRRAGLRCALLSDRSVWRIRRPRRTGERRGRGGELSRTLRGRRRGSPPRSRGRTLRAARGGSDADGAGIPTGGGTTHAPCSALDPSRGISAGDACTGAIPTGGGTRLPRVTRGEAPSHGGTTRPRRGLFMGLQRLATPSTKLLAREAGLHRACPRFAAFVRFSAFTPGAIVTLSRRLVGKRPVRAGNECSRASGKCSARAGIRAEARQRPDVQPCGHARIFSAALRLSARSPRPPVRPGPRAPAP